MSGQAQAQAKPTVKKAKLALRTIYQVVTVADAPGNPAEVDFESSGDTDTDLDRARKIAADNGWTDLVDWDAGIEDERDWHADGQEL